MYEIIQNIATRVCNLKLNLSYFLKKKSVFIIPNHFRVKFKRERFKTDSSLNTKILEN